MTQTSAGPKFSYSSFICDKAMQTLHRYCFTSPTRKNPNFDKNLSILEFYRIAQRISPKRRRERRWSKSGRIQPYFRTTFLRACFYTRLFQNRNWIGIEKGFRILTGVQFSRLQRAFSCCFPWIERFSPGGLAVICVLSPLWILITLLQVLKYSAKQDFPAYNELFHGFSRELRDFPRAVGRLFVYFPGHNWVWCKHIEHIISLFLYR